MTDRTQKQEPTPFEYAGRCDCGHRDSRHEAVDDWIERLRAGHPAVDIAADAGVPVEMVEIAGLAAEYEPAP